MTILASSFVFLSKLFFLYSTAASLKDNFTYGQIRPILSLVYPDTQKCHTYIDVLYIRNPYNGRFIDVLYIRNLCRSFH